MDTRNIIRAWKDEEYRLSLNEAERAMLPAHPAGFIELTDAEMGYVAGGSWGINLAIPSWASATPSPYRRQTPAC